MDSSERSDGPLLDETKEMVEAPNELLASYLKVELEEPASEGDLPTDTFFVPVASSTRVGEASGRPGLKRKLGHVAVKEEPADVRFAALVDGVVKLEKKEGRAECWQAPPPLSVDWRRFTGRCASLGESVVGTRLKSYKQRATPEGVRTSVELAFGREPHHLMYAVFHSEDSRLLSDAAITEFFFNDDDVVREALPALRRLHKEEMYQSLLLGVGAFGRLRDRRADLLDRLRAEYGHLVSVESTAEGSQFIQVTPYFRALWTLVYRKSTDSFDNAFEFYCDYQDTPLVVSLGEFARLTEDEDLDEDEVARCWEVILTEVNQLAQRGAY